MTVNTIIIIILRIIIIIIRKRKWLVLDYDEAQCPKFEEFEVKHDYLMAENKGMQVRCID